MKFTHGNVLKTEVIKIFQRMQQFIQALN